MSAAQPFPNIPHSSRDDARGALLETLLGAIAELTTGFNYLSLRRREEQAKDPQSEVLDAYDAARYEVSNWADRIGERVRELEASR
ncbi:MAG: hypothetical protein KGI98_11980 [Euryarchaeota archaeon]|nr:hypothetical protein [Euryarchaeota archaeon]MDE1881577.1 hypothetical protein [Euryarchaeota archaeon]